MEKEYLWFYLFMTKTFTGSCQWNYLYSNLLLNCNSSYLLLRLVIHSNEIYLSLENIENMDMQLNHINFDIISVNSFQFRM